MQHIENNIDELFRRAAADYSLQDSGDNWERIAPALLNVVPPASRVQKERKVKKYSPVLLISFFLIFVAGIATTDIYYDGSRQMDNISPENRILTGIRHINRSGPLQQNAAIIKIISVKKGFDRQKGNISGSRRLLNTVTNIPITKNASNKSVNNGLQLNEIGVAALQRKAVESIVPSGTADSQAQLVDNAPPASSKVQVILPHGVEKNNCVADSADSQTGSQKPAAKSKHGIYWGGVFGPSFNQVKSQGLQRPGFDIGLLAGYQLSKRLSIETGVLYEKKYYFSDGKYFDITKASSGMPAGMKVVSLEGSCAVIEIPFKVKYNLLSKADKHFYATAGISGYVVTGEYNKYHAILNGTEQNITGTYNKSTGYTAAVMVLGVGYENRVGKTLLVRISPYVQIPLRGIGVGSLPVMTAGLNIGFTRFLK